VTSTEEMSSDEPDVNAWRSLLLYGPIILRMVDGSARSPVPAPSISLDPGSSMWGREVDQLVVGQASRRNDTTRRWMVSTRHRRGMPHFGGVRIDGNHGHHLPRGHPSPKQRPTVGVAVQHQCTSAAAGVAISRVPSRSLCRSVAAAAMVPAAQTQACTSAGRRRLVPTGGRSPGPVPSICLSCARRPQRRGRTFGGGRPPHRSGEPPPGTGLDGLDGRYEPVAEVRLHITASVELQQALVVQMLRCTASVSMTATELVTDSRVRGRSALLHVIEHAE